jgi:hypothetical protein
VLGTLNKENERKKERKNEKRVEFLTWFGKRLVCARAVVSARESLTKKSKSNNSARGGVGTYHHAVRLVWMRLV